MRAVVAYESMFGYTRQVAEAIGDGLGLKFDVSVMLESGAAGLGMSPLVTGRAAPKIARSLQRTGCHLIAEPESFLVTTKQPRLVVGERERARAWGETSALAGAEFRARSDA